MRKIYLIVGSNYSDIAICFGRDDIDAKKLGILGDQSDLEIYEIGTACPETPPGFLLYGPAEELTGLRPLGKDVT